MDETYRGPYSIIGPPGTGKTARIAASVKRIVAGGLKPLVCSYTRTAAAEASGRIPSLPREMIGTLHSHAHRALGSPHVAAGKALKSWNEEHPALRLTGGGADVDEPAWDRYAGSTPGDELLGAMDLLRSRQVPRDRWPVSIQSFAHQWQCWKHLEGVIDFTDMIENALLGVELAPGEPDIIIADEAQDFSSLEYALIRKWGVNAGASICVGDPWQALYTWRGAHPELFTDPEIPMNHRQVLGTSYRIPGAVHALSARWIKQLSDWFPIEFAPRDEPGEVLPVSINYNCPENILDRIAEWLESGTVMLAASCSYMLRPLLAVLRDEGIAFANPWRAKRGDWNPLSKRQSGVGLGFQSLLAALEPGRDGIGAWTGNEMTAWGKLMRADGLFVRGSKTKIATLADQHDDTLLEFQEVAHHFLPPARQQLSQLVVQRDAVGLCRWATQHAMGKSAGLSQYLGKLIQRDGLDGLQTTPRVFVGTIHSFKGAEADTVILFPDLSPKGMASWHTKKKARDSVVRMFYVGMTRAKQRLALAAPASASCVPFRT